MNDNSSINKEDIIELCKIQRCNELERELSAEEINKIIRYVERTFASFITKNFLAYDSDELVGWLGIYEVFSSTILLDQFHPIIASLDNRKKIARELLWKSIEYAKSKKIANIRVFNEVTKDYEGHFLEVEQHYLNVGMLKSHVVICMENKISSNKLQGIIINDEYHIEPLKTQTIDSLRDCFYTIFADSNDNFTNSLDDEEHKNWGFIAKGEFNDASIVIKKNHELVALIFAVDEGEYIELGPIGVVPNHRGKKLGKILMEECLSSLIKQGKFDCYLEVDETNIPAINLYTSYGFFEVSKKHGYLWRM
ncbi:MAG: GNAT family N-acetyltransferase [Candidatus Heimdallarchaeota archaeon]|nr:GNAT family N-acetyltransferase [Candidatus Heimdallarchaeota archaeon]